MVKAAEPEKDANTDEKGKKAGEPSPIAQITAGFKRLIKIKKPAISWQRVASIIILNILASALCLSVYDHFFVQKIAVMDVNQYINHLKEQYIKGTITDKELADAPQKVKAAMDAAGDNTIILIEEAVLTHGNHIKIKD